MSLPAPTWGSPVAGVMGAADQTEAVCTAAIFGCEPSANGEDPGSIAPVATLGNPKNAHSGPMTGRP
jgi:hypothetical protein